MKAKLRVLIAEDNPVDAELMVRELRRAGFDPEWERVETEAAYLQRIEAGGIDLILSDYQMPEFTGIRALDLLLARGLDAPFIIISGSIGEDAAVEAMRLGATDYLLKDRLTRLGQAVEHALEHGRLRRERQRAAESLRLFRTLVDQSNDAFEVVDAVTGRFLDVNERACLTHGYSRAEHLALYVWDIDPEASEAGWPELVEKLREKNCLSREGVHRRKNGTTFPIELNAKWIRLDRDYIVAVVRDITERKKLESQMLRAQRMESIGTLAAGVAHDLNNILAPIMMSVPMLRRELPPGERDGILTTIEISAERGAAIVRQVLTFGRGVEGERRTLRIADLVADLEKIMREAFPKNLQITATVEPGLWGVVGDATQLHQVLLNLCVNARDAMPEGGSLRVRARNLEIDANYASMLPDAQPGAFVALEVADDGSGISPEILDRIFDPFFTTKAVGRGTGLGLSTVLGIVKSHGGFIKVASQPGVGTRFTVHFPAAPAVAGEEDVPPPDVLPHGQGEWILVVDDEAPIRRALQAVLKLHGYHPLLAADGTEALALFAQNAERIGVVVTDLAMPFMDGITLIRALQKMRPALAVIASTGQGEKARVAELKALHIHGILNKPYGKAELLRSIDAALHPARPAGPLP